MRYRAEIDGLRAVAVVPVVLFHAGFQVFRGGYVGVDIFFVVSGYLITAILMNELRNDRFSIIAFYERRARRILPALFLVMSASAILAYFWMLPSELRSFGQSLVATSFFSNNILLLLTSGYWALASEFKPLLHTWSLGVEEQYYIVFPPLLMLGWRFLKEKTVLPLAVLASASLLAAHWLSKASPDVAFYSLVTRCWELLMGSLIAIYVGNRSTLRPHKMPAQLLSLAGLLLILLSIFSFNSNLPSPSFYTLAPTVGAALIILFADEQTWVGTLLSNRLMVGIGLISYSVYLWHFPLIALARIYSVTPLGAATSSVIFILTFGLAYLSWRFIETPFRNKDRFSRSQIFLGSFIVSVLFVAYGLFLTRSNGLPSRIYSRKIADSNDIYITYNERVYGYKRDSFAKPELLNVLVIGNSFARDFVNMTIENFDLENVELVYRNDFDDCASLDKSDVLSALVTQSDVVVFASGVATKGCVERNLAVSMTLMKPLFYIGPKHFGWNLNWLARLDASERRNLVNPLPAAISTEEKLISTLVPSENFISLLAPIVVDGTIPVTDEEGRLLSEDRMHLTRYGAQYVGQRALAASRFGDIMRSSISIQTSIANASHYQPNQQY